MDPAYPFEFIGGAPCLDLVNTLGGRDSPSPDDHLATYGDVVEWSRQAGAISSEQAQRLLAEAARRPAAARRVLADVVSLREAIARVFRDRAHGRRPAAADLATLNAALPRALAQLEIAPRGDEFAWRFRPGSGALDSILWPAIRSAADLLLEPPQRLGRCESPTCGWLFVDTSRNHSRRWCVMGVCGNRAKARRLYKRRKAGDHKLSR